MKKALIAIAGVMLSGIAAQGATLQLTTGVGAATLLKNSGGDPFAGGVWGVLIDTAGDGFSSEYATTLLGETLQTGYFGGSNDFLYLSANSTLAAGPLTGAATQVIVNYDFEAALTGGLSYTIVWFEGVAAGEEIVAGTNFGISPATATLPASNGDAVSPVEFHGDNGIANLVVVPEPSAALLAAIGTLGLFRRRR